MIYFTSDQHFFHKNIIQYCDRPFETVTKMNNVLINNYNNIVGKDDTVCFLGDFSMTKNFEQISSIVKKLNGVKHLVLGNHDEMSAWEYIKAGFHSVHTSLQIKEFSLIHDPAIRTALHEDTKLLCGHVHTLFTFLKDKQVLNVGVDVHNYRPISIDYARTFFSK